MASDAPKTAVMREAEDPTTGFFETPLGTVEIVGAGTEYEAVLSVLDTVVVLPAARTRALAIEEAARLLGALYAIGTANGLRVAEHRLRRLTEAWGNEAAGLEAEGEGELA